MFKHIQFIAFLSSILFFTNLEGQVVINEFMAANSSTLADPDGGEFDDWVELHNNGNTAVNVGGYFMSDNAIVLQAWQIPTNNAAATTIPAGGYLLIWFDNQMSQGLLHAAPKLSASGDMIVLTAADGQTILDSVSFGQQLTDVSVGRWPNGIGSFVNMTGASPNLVNISSLVTVATPTSSVTSGFYTSTQTVTLSCATAGATIRYTLDGSMPTTSSTIYVNPISISATKTLRAAAFYTDYQPSQVLTNTYFVNVSHTFPVFALSTNPAYVFDPLIGIFPNYNNDTLEQPMHFEFFNNNILAYEAEAVANVSGTGSAVYDQKSMAIQVSDLPTFDYPFFPAQPNHDYESFVLRNSGQDWNVTMFRDAMVSGLMRDFDDVASIIRRPNLDLQGYRPSVAYLNGEYWGIYNLREHMTDTYIQTHYNIGGSSLDLIENSDEIKKGDLVAWNSFKTFYSNNDFATTANFDSLKAMMDMDNWLDYNIFAIYVDNADWPSNNNRRWREKTVDGKWRWLCYDYDFSFGLFQQGGGWNTGDASPNSLARALTSDNLYAWPNAEWSTRLLRKCLENPQFKQDFVNRMADMINVTFDSVRVNNHIEALQATYQPEIQKHFDKWGSGWIGNWVPNINKMKLFANNRPALVRQHVVDQFVEVTGTANVTLQANPVAGGSIHFSTLTMPSGNLPWVGTYFKGVNIPFQAIPNRGYTFSTWSDASLGTSAVAQINLTANKTITANFTQGSTSTSPIVINEINYNSSDTIASDDWVELYNPNTSSVNISGWYLEDESGSFYGIPANTTIPANGFLVLVEDSLAFNTYYPSANIVRRGNFGEGFNAIKLGNSGETIQLFNAAGVKIDSVFYDDIAPWPSNADGTGLTAQLLAPNLNNSTPSNWIGQAATPGAANIAVVQQAQDITFPAIPNKLTTSLPFTVNATSSSGLVPTYSIVSGPATVSGNTISLTGISGTVIVQASQTGNANFLAATPQVQSFVVNKASQTITFPTIASKPSNALPFTLNATASSGLTVIYNITSGPATVSGNVITLTGATGTVIVRARQLGNAQYLAAPNVSRSFSVTQAPQQNQAITFPAIPNKLTTDAPFTLAATASSNLPVTYTLISGPATISGNTVTLTGIVGTVTIQGNQAGNAAYFAAPSVTQTFTVTAPGVLLSQTITFPSIPNKLVNDLPFTVNATASSGLPILYNILSGPATMSGNTITLTGVEGTVKVRARQLGNAQYQAATNIVRSFNVTALPAQTYCIPSSTPWYEWISNIQLNTINSTTSKTTYGNYTATSTTLLKGATYPFSLTGNFSYLTYDEYWRIWIDYNKNYVFEDSEIAYQGITIAPTTLGVQTYLKTGNITVPATATTGSTRMRVALKRGAYPTACEVIPYGEVEDYSIVISNAFNYTDTNLDQPIAPNTLRNTAADVSIFPNPANEQVNIMITPFANLPLDIVVCDMTGKSVYTTHYNKVIDTNINIPTEKWPVGVYYIRFVTTDNKPMTKQIIVIR